MPGPAWTLLQKPSEPAASAQGDVTLAERLATASSNGQHSVTIPRVSALGDVIDIYQQLIGMPQTLLWLASTGLETDSLTLYRDRVEGYVTRDGVRTAVSFSTTDGSGWWEASVNLRAIRDLLDPNDKGLPYLREGEQRMPLHVVSHAYGLDAHDRGRTVKDGLSLPFTRALKDVQRVISDLDERAYLATLLEQRVQGLADDATVDWSAQRTRVSPASAEGMGVQAHCDIQQLLEHKGLGSPRTVGATRNVIQWLRTTMAPASTWGDYSGLAATASDPTHLRPLDSLARQTPDSLRLDPDTELARLLKSADAPVFRGQMADIQINTPGNIAGFDLYQPAHMGRTLKQVRSDLERHLCETKSLDPKVAVLVAHIGLARTAPEFLVRDVPDAVALGTPAWLELRLGCAIADAVAPGASRAMNEAQISALTTLAPTSEEQRTLLQARGLGGLLVWAVLNGVVPAKPEGQHTQADFKRASQMFTRQRTLATRAFKAASTPLPTRRVLAVQALLKVFPLVSQSQLEAMTVHLTDANQRRNLVASEPRTRSLIETYMSGDLVPGKWVLSQDLPLPAATSSRTPFQFQNTAQVPNVARENLDVRIRRLPALDSLLESAVGTHHRKLQMAFVTKLKLMLAGLPLADRQRIELGAIDLFTLRKKTGKQQVWETDGDRSAVTGRQGTLMRVLHAQAVTYYEIFNSGNIVRHSDPVVISTLDRVVRDQSHLGQYKLLGEKFIRGGHEVPLDFDAYATGNPAKTGAKSGDVIIDRLGRYLEAGSLPEKQTLETFVPDSYQSDRVEFIACEIAENNFYESLESMFQRAKGQLSVEKSRQANARDINLLMSLVPFVGAYQDFAAGNIGKGLQSLALDTAGVVMGAGGQARALMHSVKKLVQGSVVPALNGIGGKVAPGVARLGLAGPKVRISDAAFDVTKQSAAFFNAVFNPLDGYPRLMGAASRGLGKMPALLAGNGSALAKAMPHLARAEQKMRGYFLVATGMVDPAAPPVAQTP
ncbi:hypothetical protein DYL59_18610 [Pseudomonas kairouanensis]|uniref:Uncharacterized protein n=1 Tax=Pseudomonas kairouanensis TaxID=2293832 RepID=A0A4Z0ALT9_9PSED|nr:hypothetical protein [Pseudomonas kairouanensis]TFY87370.1 hypothetical protein DYL59_18610 [Pseudomonas kairouanensis]